MSNHPPFPDGWQYDPYWQTAAVLLDGFDASDARVWRHVTPFGIDYAAILDEPGWSGGERRILQAAASMWAGQPVSLLDLTAGLGEAYWQRLTRALAVLRSGLT